jgi:hypothetical protein
VQAPVRLLAQRISALDEESRHYPVKRGPVEKPHLRQVQEIFHMAGRIVRIKPQMNVPEPCRDHCPRIFLLKPHGHAATLPSLSVTLQPAGLLDFPAFFL